jgi:hypothetical protein
VSNLLFVSNSPKVSPYHIVRGGSRVVACSLLVDKFFGASAPSSAVHSSLSQWPEHMPGLSGLPQEQ